MSNWEKYLKDIYLDPSHPASFGGPDRLYKIVNKEAIWLYAELFLGHHDGSCHGLW